MSLGVTEGRENRTSRLSHPVPRVWERWLEYWGLSRTSQFFPAGAGASHLIQSHQQLWCWPEEGMETTWFPSPSFAPSCMLSYPTFLGIRRHGTHLFSPLTLPLAQGMSACPPLYGALIVPGSRYPNTDEWPWPLLRRNFSSSVWMHFSSHSLMLKGKWR